MRILIYHPVQMPVLQYGGTERVVLWLAKSLVNLGHEVTVFAAPGSSMPEGIHCMTDPAILLKSAAKFDVLHGFTRFDSKVEEAAHGKVLITIQGNGQKGERFHRNTVFVSRNHAERHGAREFVYNGLDPDELSFEKGPRSARYLFISKTSWRVKNLKGAMKIAAQARQDLWIAGGEGPLSLKAKTWIKKISGKDWNWVGSVNQAEKAKFLLQGQAMLFPLLWNEPFGLVMTESLVSGTPVLAHPFGSVPEILEFAPQCLMNTPEDWSRALSGGIELPDPQICRDWVLAHFEQRKMAMSYLKLYERVSSGKLIHETEPVTRVGAEEISFH